MACPKALLLLDRYYEALNAFHDARRRGSQDYELRFSELKDVRAQYWDHVKSHGCRPGFGSSYRLATESRLRDEMEQARKRHEEAKLTYKRLEAIAADCESGTDGVLALKQATALHAKTYQDYRTAFRRFADYVIYGDNSEL